jgi:hypothetical protein
MGYVELEAAVIAKFIEKFPDELSESRVKAGDLDSVFNAIYSEGEQYGVFLEFNGGREDTRRPYSTPAWMWTIGGVMAIRYSDTIESDLRTMIDKLKLLFDDDHTLGGLTPRAKFFMIDMPEISKVGDIPYYWLPFQIEVIDR